MPDIESHHGTARERFLAFRRKQKKAPALAEETGAAVAAALRRDGYDWTSIIASIRVPTLLLHGEDNIVSPDVAHSLSALIEGSKLELIPYAGHMPFWEAPEEFFRLVDEFPAD